MTPVLLDYAKHRDLIAPADVLLWKGKGLVSRIIGWRTGSEWSHASLADVNRGRVWLFESREGVGIRHVPLSAVLAMGTVSWFTHAVPDTGAGDVRRLEREAAIEYCIARVGERYDWGGILRIARATWPWGKALSPADGEELPRGKGAICSAFVSAALRAGGRDLVAQRADRVTTPGDLSRSGLLVYRGDLTNVE